MRQGWVNLIGAGPGDPELLTGHARDGSEPDWRALRASGNTLVIYMGMARLDALVAGMLAAGYVADTPACAIQNATLAGQRVILAPLAPLPRVVAEVGLASPAIVVVGEVVRFANVARRVATARAA